MRHVGRSLVLLCFLGAFWRGLPAIEISDSFDNGVIDPPLVVGNYLQEEQGTFGPLSDLEVDETGGQLSIHGTGTHDVEIVEGHGVGWIGRSAYFPVEPVGGGVVAVEAKIQIKSARLTRGGGSDSGYLAGVLLETAPGERIDFFLIENVNGPTLQCLLDVGGNFGLPGASFTIQLGATYTLRLELDVVSKRVRCLVDGVVRIQEDFGGDPAITRAGVMAGVRFFGDILDARFDDLKVSYVPKTPVGARRTIQTTLEDDGATADVTLQIDVPGTASVVHEKLDPGWTVSGVSGGGQVGDGITWTNVTERQLTYRLSRTGLYSEAQAKIQGTLESEGTLYIVGGDAFVGGVSSAFVEEVLVTPSFRIGRNLDGCTVRAADVNGAWLGECVGVRDDSIVPHEGLSFRPAFGTEWSQASGLDPDLPPAARARFWSNPDDPGRSLAVLAKVRGNEGRFDWEGPAAFDGSLGRTMCVAFFYTNVDGDQPVTVHVGMGSDDSSGIRVNGEPAAVEIGCGGPACFAGKHALTLLPGKNLISFYTFQNAGGYSACIRFEDSSGNPIAVRTTLDPAGYVPPAGIREGHDCNGNCRADSEDIAGGVSLDHDANGIPDECEAVWIDCNHNGIADREDIEAGHSLDRDGNTVPDECEEALSIQLGAPYCASIRLDTKRTTLGGEIALAYDSTLLEAVCPVAGQDLDSRSTIVCNLEPALICDLPPGMDRALVVAWLNTEAREPLGPGSHEVLRLCFTPRPEAGTGRVCAPIAFTGCVGVPGAPVLNGVTDDSNISVRLFTVGGEVCGEEEPYLRGDVNSDGVIDISDPIALLGCKFLGSTCPSCLDAADANDDGRVDISDASYLLTWRFLGGKAPPPPFPDCGADPSPDALRGCVGSHCTE